MFNPVTNTFDFSVIVILQLSRFLCNVCPNNDKPTARYNLIVRLTLNVTLYASCSIHCCGTR